MRSAFLITIFLMLTLSADDFRKGTVKVDNLRMRSKPGIPSVVLGNLDKGAQIKIIEEKDGWLRIQAPEVLTGWMSNKFIDKGVINGNDVRVRAGPNVASQVVSVLNKGDLVEVLKTERGVWAKVKLPEDVPVWVSAAFIELEAKEVVVETEEELKKEAEALAAKEKMKADKIAALKESLALEKKATEEAHKKLLEQQEELARLELEKNQAEIARQEQEKKAAAIKILLELEQKKRSKKLVVKITADDQLKIGSQETAFEDLEKNYKLAGEGTLVFINADKEADDALIKKVSDKFKELKAKVYLEDPSRLFENTSTQLAEEFKESKIILEKSYITLSVKKPRLLYVGTVPVPEQHLESVLRSYGESFGSTAAYIQADPGVDKDFIDNLMKVVQKCGFKLISYPKGFGKEVEVDGGEVEVVAEGPVDFNDEEEKALKPGRIRMTGYVLNVRQEDKAIVDYALAVQVNGQFYPIAFLKGKKQELQSFYLKEIEIIGVQKRLDGWTKPVLFVEEFKLSK